MDNSQLLLKKIAVDCDLESAERLLNSMVPMPNTEKSMALFRNYRPAAAVPREQAEQIADFIDNKKIVFPVDLWSELCYKILRSKPQYAEGYYRILENLLYSASFRSTVTDCKTFMDTLEKRPMNEQKREIFQRMKYRFSSLGLIGENNKP